MNIDTFKNHLGLASVSFDMFAVEVFSSLLLGRTLYLLNEEELKNPLLISKKIIENRIEFLITTPTKIDLLTSTKEISSCLKYLKAFQLGGEVFSPSLFKKLNNFTNAKIYNGYGPTEASACCSNKYITSDSNINIGTPIPNTHIYVLDKDFNLCPIGVPGELYIGGIAISSGYINDYEKSVESFITSKFNNEKLYKTGDIGRYTPLGELEYIGRNDFQVKINGLRIELSEIEAQLLSIKNISSAVVIPDLSKKYLKAFVVSPKQLNISQIRTELYEKLPTYMIPKFICQIDSIPMTNNGKTDINFMNNYGISNYDNSVTYTEPETDLQNIFCNIWCNILGTQVGIDNDLFELGADSLSAILFKIEALNRGIDVPYANIFKYKTIRKLSEAKAENVINTPIENFDYSNINKVLSKNKIQLFYDTTFLDNNNVLLLGSNGFVGMHIINSFIKNDSGTIYCMMRRKDNEDALTRFLKILHFYFGSSLDSYIGNRIIILEGDITKPNFGLNNSDLQLIINNISTIINSAANVKHFGDFQKFKNINIGVIQNAIVFCKSYSKRLIHISTLSISGNMLLDGSVSKDVFQPDDNDRIYFSEQNLFIHQSLDNVYTRSKYEAEKILLEQIYDGLDAQILRLGNITSRYSDGKFQINPSENAFAKRLQSFVAIGIIPESLLSQEVEFTPVDLCSDAIIKCLQYKSNTISVLHIYDRNHVTINEIVQISNELGINLKTVNDLEFSEFIQTNLSNQSFQNDISGIINDISTDKKVSYKNNTYIKSDFSNDYLLHCKFRWATINEEYIRKYIQYLNDINFIKI